ncbi:hypothetical protein ACMD2_21249 [Ananas comosus]|uniref:Uncharacterized protein n=1 Tax=Ananas comosus TaxID=4615 RepID=A0A199W6J4_ANACO|nr:hypothetical protein ACMD2_21249 [Ananas comosus]
MEGGKEPPGALESHLCWLVISYVERKQTMEGVCFQNALEWMNLRRVLGHPFMISLKKLENIGVVVSSEVDDAGDVVVLDMAEAMLH